MAGLGRGLTGDWGWPPKAQHSPEPDIRLTSLLPPSSVQAPRLPALPASVYEH